MPNENAKVEICIRYFVSSFEHIYFVFFSSLIRVTRESQIVTWCETGNGLSHIDVDGYVARSHRLSSLFCVLCMCALGAPQNKVT